MHKKLHSLPVPYTTCGHSQHAAQYLEAKTCCRPTGFAWWEIFCTTCPSHVYCTTESGNTRLSNAHQELNSQDLLFKDSKHSLKELSRQSTGERCVFYVLALRISSISPELLRHENGIQLTIVRFDITSLLDFSLNFSPLEHAMVGGVAHV